MLRPTDLLRLGVRQALTIDELRVKPMVILVGLLVLVSVLTGLLIVAPLLVSRRRALRENRGAARFLMYFSAIGVGFMMVEMAFIQQFVLLLGSPVYSLAVILFSLLLSSSLGSLLTHLARRWPAASLGMVVGLLMIVALPLYMTLTPPIVHTFMGSPTPLKMIVAFAAICPIGVVMGC